MSGFFQIDSFSHQGKRENNEDSVFPSAEIPTALENLFLVCDGVGGLNKGEIASDLCCTQFSAYFLQNHIEVSDKSVIDAAVNFVEKKFDSYMTNNPESMDMASTVTLLHFHKKGTTIAHLGDSRVYHFRNGEIIYKTKDHSVVQELFEAGIITEDEMSSHRDRNRISRAMRGASIKSYKADIYVENDIEAGDFFFMCTDGVLESFSDDELKEIFASTEEVETINAKIVRKCAENSNDNYSAYTIKIQQDYINSLSKNDVITVAESTEEETHATKTELPIEIEKTTTNDNNGASLDHSSEEILDSKDEESGVVPILEENKTVVPFENRDPLKEEDNNHSQRLEEVSKKSSAFSKSKLTILLLVLVAIVLGYLVYTFLIKSDKEIPAKQPESGQVENEIPADNPNAVISPSVSNSPNNEEMTSTEDENTDFATLQDNSQAEEKARKDDLELARKKEKERQEKLIKENAQQTVAKINAQKQKIKAFETKAKEFLNKENYVEAIYQLKEAQNINNTDVRKTKIKSLIEEGNVKAANQLSILNKEYNKNDSCTQELKEDYKKLKLLTDNQEILNKIPCNE